MPAGLPALSTPRWRRFVFSFLDSGKRLDSVGDAGDVIDRELQTGTRLPGTLRLYLSCLVKASPDVLQRCCHLVPGTDISKVQPPGGCEYQHGCQVNKLLIYVCIVSDHEKKCGCIQEWMIDGAGLLTFRKPNMTSDLYNITIHFTVSWRIIYQESRPRTTNTINIYKN